MDSPCWADRGHQSVSNRPQEASAEQGTSRGQTVAKRKAASVLQTAFMVNHGTSKAVYCQQAAQLLTCTLEASREPTLQTMDASSVSGSARLLTDAKAAVAEQ
jgi:hypothetical protein